MRSLSEKWYLEALQEQSPVGRKRLQNKLKDSDFQGFDQIMNFFSKSAKN